MAITKLPASLVWPGYCAICCVPLAPDKATAGLIDANGCQAFACVSHFSEISMLIVGWAQFIAAERKRYECTQQKPFEQLYKGGNA